MISRAALLERLGRFLADVVGPSLAGVRVAVVPGRASRWSPSHLERALAGGRGAVLWVHRFRPLVRFVALHAAGFTVCRPSVEDHGFFSTRAGMRWLNPIQVRAEEPWCERVVAGAGLAHLRALSDRLAANRLVSFYFDMVPGTRNVSVPFLAGRLSVATRPLTLARDAGKPLLPVFPLGAGRGRFRVVIEAPLALPDARDALPDAIAEHARTLAWYVGQYPDEWHDWWRVETDAPAAGTAIERAARRQDLPARARPGGP